MKKILLLLASLATSYGQQFNGTVFDPISRRIQFFNGQLEERYMTRHEEIMEMYREMAEQREAIRMRQMQEEQLRLLREIADKQ